VLILSIIYVELACNFTPIILTLPLTALLKSVTSWPVGWIVHKPVGRSAHSCERWVLQKEIRVGGR
jgi:hypothetical protein